MAKPSTAAPDWREEFFDLDSRILLDCANAGPLPRACVRAVEEALELKKYPERLSNEAYFALPRDTRAALARLIGAAPEEIALTSGASDGINAVARGLDWKPGDEIVLPVGEFPGNYFPWKHLEPRGVRVREVAPGEDRFVTADDLLGALTDRTRLVAASSVGYADGNRIDLARVGAGCRARGIHLLVDASQAAGVLNFTVEQLQCDFLVSCGYKWLLSPYGTGFFYVRRELAERLEVGDIRWMNVEGAEDFNRLPREGWRLAAGARRWDATEASSFLNLAGMKASVELLLRVGVGNIERQACALAALVVERLPRDRCVLRSPREANRRGAHVCVAARTAEATRRLWERLSAEKVFVSLRQDALRIAPNFYNREWEIERLLGVLTA